MLRDRRLEIISYIRANKKFLALNSEMLNIYEGNLLPYVDAIMRESLSPNYYNAIKERILPINILQRFIDKVSNTYSKAPKRSSLNARTQEFIDYYADEMSINQSGQIADSYSNMFKCFAWEPYIDKNGKPAIRELPANSFLVKSDSSASPEEETMFIKFMGNKGETEEELLVHVYTDTEFDAFYMSGVEATEYLIENQGINVIGCIPFVYGKRQKNRLLPIIDSDMVKVAKAIPVMLSDAAGAQKFQCWSQIYGINLNFDNVTISPNVIWSLKSDNDSDKAPVIGTIKPEADTEKVLSFVTQVFSIWLMTKGVSAKSIGSIDAGNTSSGIAKVIDEMDVYEIIKKSQEWFEKDESELWNIKMPKIHNYWIKSGMVNPAMVPGLLPEGVELDIEIEFVPPEPMKTRMELINEIKSEIDLGTMTMEQAIKSLHPDHDQDKIDETINGRVLV